MDLSKKGFQLPQKIAFEEETLRDTYGKLVAEPLERGFGTTLGNALRRVLLSSIEGTAVTGVKINGALHEFAQLEGIKEDVVDIILNIKKLRFAMDGEGSKMAVVKMSGPAEIKGGNLKVDSSVKLMNPDQTIATVGKGISFEAELYLNKGKGYVGAEQNKEEGLPVDVIAVDSAFSPVTKVNFHVEKARVGRSTDYDKLIMEIWTDGSVSPVSVISQAARIITEHSTLFVLEEEWSEEEPERAQDEAKGAASFNENLLRSVDELELSVRAHNCLKNANIKTIADLVQRSEHDMLRTKNFGRKSLNEIKEILSSMGLHLGMRVDTDALTSRQGRGNEA
jgi:DNA-directed RNA polymerase subunit alpha